MNPSEILQLITLSVAGWTLREVFRISNDLSGLKQQVKDLPCEACPPNNRNLQDKNT